MTLCVGFIDNQTKTQVADLEEHNVLRKERSYVYNTFSPKKVVERRSEKNLKIHLLYIDVQKAYNRVFLIKLWTAPREQVNVASHSRLICCMSARVKLGCRLSEQFSSSRGLLLPQLFV